MAFDALSLVVLAAMSAGQLSNAGEAGTKAIRPEALSAHIRFLADDLFEGREPGTRGHALAEKFVAAELAALGLEPAGEDGTFFQSVPLRATRVSPASVRVELRSRGSAPVRLVNERDVIFLSAGYEENVSVTAPLVFAGFGITAPEYAHDDLAGLDLRGKIAVVFFGTPRGDDASHFPPTARAWYTRITDKANRLRARGAVGILVVRTPAAENIYPWSKLVRDARQFEGMEWLEGDRPGTWPEGLPVIGQLTVAAFDRMLALGRAGVGAEELLRRGDERTLRGFDLPVTMRAESRASFRPVVARNVAALLRGAEPALSREVVVYTAHLDHLGGGSANSSGKDVVFNGAVDNASGVAGLLAVARAFAAGPRPARSVMFLAVTAEEKGMLGSEYFVHRPTVPRDAIVAALNLDMLPFFPSHSVVALGADHSTLGVHVRAAVEALGTTLAADPFPELVLFVRSDQRGFVAAGIPALWINGGFQDERGEAAANTAAFEAFRAKHYHQPSDEWSPALDFDAMARTARAAYLAGLSVATSPERPRWNGGDFFERLAAPRSPPVDAYSAQDR